MVTFLISAGIRNYCQCKGLQSGIWWVLCIYALEEHFKDMKKAHNATDVTKLRLICEVWSKNTNWGKVLNKMD